MIDLPSLGEWATVTEAADYLGRTPQHVRSLCQECSDIYAEDAPDGWQIATVTLAAFKFVMVERDRRFEYTRRYGKEFVGNYLAWLREMCDPQDLIELARADKPVIEVVAEHLQQSPDDGPGPKVFGDVLREHGCSPELSLVDGRFVRGWRGIKLKDGIMA